MALNSNSVQPPICLYDFVLRYDNSLKWTYQWYDTKDDKKSIRYEGGIKRKIYNRIKIISLGHPKYNHLHRTRNNYKIIFIIP